MSGQDWLLDHFYVDGDTLRGAGYDFEVAHRPKVRAATSVVIAMDQVDAIEEQKRRTKQKLMIYGRMLAVGLLTLVLGF